jgi:hypothetical protein
VPFSRPGSGKSWNYEKSVHLSLMKSYANFALDLFVKLLFIFSLSNHHQGSAQDCWLFSIKFEQIKQISIISGSKLTLFWPSGGHARPLPSSTGRTLCTQLSDVFLARIKHQFGANCERSWKIEHGSLEIQEVNKSLV